MTPVMIQKVGVGRLWWHISSTVQAKIVRLPGRGEFILRATWCVCAAGESSRSESFDVGPVQPFGADVASFTRRKDGGNFGATAPLWALPQVDVGRARSAAVRVIPDDRFEDSAQRMATLQQVQ